MTSQRERDGEGARIAALLERLPPEAEPAADEAIRDAEDAGKLVERLEALVAAHEDVDAVVADADSLSDLAAVRDSLVDPGDVAETTGERAVPSGTAPTEGRLDPPGASGTQLDPSEASGARPDPPGASGTGNRGDTPDRDPARCRVAGGGGDPTGDGGSGGPLSGLRSAVGSVLDRLPWRGGASTGADGGTRTDTGSPSDGGGLPARSDGPRSPVARIRDRTGAGLDRVKYTVKNASPGEAALWGLGAGLAVANPAIAAGYSTYVLLGGAVAGGVGLGAYKSSHENTALDGVDPLAVGREINRVTASNRSLEDVDPERVGAMLGASTDVLERVTPEAYAQWAVRADPEAVFRGAQYGAEYADRLDGRRAGIALGGGMGLLYGYAAADGDVIGEGVQLRRLAQQHSPNVDPDPVEPLAQRRWMR